MLCSKNIINIVVISLTFLLISATNNLRDSRNNILNNENKKEISI